MWTFYSLEPAFFRQFIGSWWDFVYGLLVLISICLVTWIRLDSGPTVFITASLIDVVMIVDASVSALIRVFHVIHDFNRIHISSCCNNLVGIFVDLVCCIPYLYLITRAPMTNEECDMVYKSICVVRITRLFTPGRIAIGRDVRELLYQKYRENNPKMDRKCRENEEESFKEFQKTCDENIQYQARKRTQSKKNK